MSASKAAVAANTRRSNGTLRRTGKSTAIHGTILGTARSGRANFSGATTNPRWVD